MSQESEQSQPIPAPARFTGPPGPDLSAELAGTDPGRLADLEAVAYLQAWERQVAHDTAAAWAAAALVAARVRTKVRRGLPERTGRLEHAPQDIEERAAISEVAMAVHISPGAAETRIARGEALTGRLAPAAALVRDGALTASHVTVLAEHTTGRDPDLVADILTRVLPRAVGKTPGELGKALTRAPGPPLSRGGACGAPAK